MSQRLTDKQLARLRTFRGYTEDEAELAAMAADEIEGLRVALGQTVEALLECLDALTGWCGPDVEAMSNSAIAQAHAALDADA